VRPPASRRAALTQLYDDAMAPCGLRVTQFSLIRTLLREGPTRITELAGLALLDRTALSRTLEPLVADGLVRIAAGRDARTREVTLTRAGRAAYERALPYWEEAQKIVLRKLGEPAHRCARRPPRVRRNPASAHRRRPLDQNPIMNARTADWRTPTVVLVASAVILSLAMGIATASGYSSRPCPPSSAGAAKFSHIALACRT
jgi:DNA-binding MarR family transcriptional regulator